MIKAKINGYEPSAPMLKVASYNTTEYMGIPIQLQIATQLMAAAITGREFAGMLYDVDELAERAIDSAKALIRCYNETDGERPDMLEMYKEENLH